MSDLFAGCSELHDNLKIKFVEDGDESVEVDNQDVLLVLEDLEDLAAADLLVVEDFVVSDIYQPQMATHADQDTHLVGKHSVVPGVAVADSVDGGRDFGGVD